jgi:hypothetical protein
MAVKDCRGIITYYAKIKLSLIDNSALRTDLIALSTNLNTVDQNTNDILLKVGNIIDTSDIEAALEDVKDLKDSVLDDYKSDLNATLNTKKNMLIALCNELAKPTHNLRTMSYASNTFRLEELTATRTNLQAIIQLEKDNEYYDVILQKKQALDLAIEAYDAESFYDKALPIINQVDKVVEASESPATFKKELIKEGVTAAKNILRLADAAIKHDDMLKARIELIKKIKAADDRHDAIDSQLKANFNETQQILFFEKLRMPKTQYVAEVEKILGSFNSFTTIVFGCSDVLETAKRFVEHAPDLKAYANSLWPFWLRG